MAYPGKPVKSVVEFFRDARFKNNPPKILILGFTERFMDPFINSEVNEIHQDSSPSVFTMIKNSLFWPDNFKQFLEAQSLVKIFMSKQYAALKWIATGKVSPDVLAVKASDGRNILFYKPELSELKKSAKERKIDDAIKGIIEIDNACKERGIRLVLLPVPGKGNIYRNYVREADKNYNLPTNQFIDELEHRLLKSNIRIINLLPDFQKASISDTLLFWPDDTHWNDFGIRVAATKTVQYIRSDEQLWNLLNPNKSGLENRSK
jgi:hypothetical protein